MEFHKKKLKGDLKAAKYHKSEEETEWNVQGYYADEQEVRGIGVRAPVSALKRIVVRNAILKDRVQPVLKKYNVKIPVVVKGE